MSFTIYFILSLHHPDYHKMTDNNVSLPILQSLRMNINLCILLCIRWELKTVMKTSRMSKNTRRSMILILNQLSTYLKCIFTQWKKMKKILSNSVPNFFAMIHLKTLLFGKNEAQEKLKYSTTCTKIQLEC